MNRDEMNAWDEKLVSNPDGGNIFQMTEVAEVKRMGGWVPRYQELDGLAITIHEKPVFGLGKLWYLPKGPGVTSVEQLRDVLPALKAEAKKAGAFVVKIEPEFKKTEVQISDLTALSLIPVNPIQPNNSTVVLDISGSLDEIMAGLNQKGRHAIHRAERDGVTAEAVPFTDENAQTMYALLRATADGKFNTRSYDYCHAFWQNLVDTGRGQLFFATFEGKIIAGAFSAYLGRKGTYKDGASIRERTAYGASHLLQWEIIKWMKDHGVTSYDLCGTPSSDQILDESHPHYGLGRFKTSFNKEVTDYVGAYDLPIRSLAYRIWSSVGERITLRLSRAIKHEYWY
jgi:lipid II:glycine glycyltransferase (peptidoglycan interpeptide bridge formation enzyme)